MGSAPGGREGWTPSSIHMVQRTLLSAVPACLELRVHDESPVTASCVVRWQLTELRLRVSPDILAVPSSGVTVGKAPPTVGICLEGLGRSPGAAGGTLAAHAVSCAARHFCDAFGGRGWTS